DQCLGRGIALRPLRTGRSSGGDTPVAIATFWRTSAQRLGSSATLAVQPLVVRSPNKTLEGIPEFHCVWGAYVSVECPLVLEALDQLKMIGRGIPGDHYEGLDPGSLRLSRTNCSISG